LQKDDSKAHRITDGQGNDQTRLAHRRPTKIKLAVTITAKTIRVGTVRLMAGPSTQDALGRNSLYVLYPPPIFVTEKPDCCKMRVAK